MNAIVISIGEELVSGQAVDTNAAWLSGRLADHGVTILRQVTVGDNRADIAGVFRESLADADVVVSTGGLGPTADDLTRFALGDALDGPLQRSAEAEGQIRDFFKRWDRPLRETNLVQADLPQGCAPLHNALGTAPGIARTDTGGRFYALPGVPKEMQAMFERYVLPTITTDCGRTVRARIRCFGLTEAALGELLSDLMARDRNPLIGVTASSAILTVRISAMAASEAEARLLLEQDVGEVRCRLGEAVFGVDDEQLEHAVAVLLTARGRTVSTAESCTGGLLAKRLTDVPGSSRYFLQGSTTYTDASKVSMLGVPERLLAEYGAVSGPVVEAMARLGREGSGSDYTLALSGIAGPTGGEGPDKPVGLVYIALASASPTQVRRLLFGDHLTRDEVRDRSVKSALNMLRLELLCDTGTVQRGTSAR